MYSNNAAIAFAMPGGEGTQAPRSRPVDLAHLAKQTLGDRALEQEVLKLFVQQALAARDQFAGAEMTERLRIAHNLKGAARGVGAFPIADCVAAIESEPDNKLLVSRLAGLIDELRDFAAAIGR